MASQTAEAEQAMSWAVKSEEQERNLKGEIMLREQYVFPEHSVELHEVEADQDSPDWFQVVVDGRVEFSASGSQAAVEARQAWAEFCSRYEAEWQASQYQP